MRVNDVTFLNGRFSCSIMDDILSHSLRSIKSSTIPLYRKTVFETSCNCKIVLLFLIPHNYVLFWKIDRMLAGGFISLAAISPVIIPWQLIIKEQDFAFSSTILLGYTCSCFLNLHLVTSVTSMSWVNCKNKLKIL